MSAPILTQLEIDALKQQAAAQQNFADTFTAAIPDKQTKAAQYGETDGAFKKFFDYYNDQIIGEYDAEYKALAGLFIVAPITEADVLGPASINPNVRTTPILPTTDILRISEFDGGGTSTTIINEQQHIADQELTEMTLLDGYPSGGGFNPATALTTSSLSPTSTTLDVTDTTNPLTIAIGDYFVVSDGTNFGVVQVTSVTHNPGANPPYNFTYGITLIIAPLSSVAIGSSLLEFTGFTNSERASKTASDSGLQPLMNQLIVKLQTEINDRISRITEQLSALTANQDPDAVTQIAIVISDDNASKTFLTNYLVNTDISDSGIGILSTERITRSTRITTRLGQIQANYTGQTENYYDRRYGIANDRGNTQRGTLRLKIATLQSIDTMQTYAASAQDAADAINAILP